MVLVAVAVIAAVGTIASAWITTRRVERVVRRPMAREHSETKQTLGEIVEVVKAIDHRSKRTAENLDGHIADHARANILDMREDHAHLRAGD